MFMANKKLHQVYNAIDVFIRNINKYWVKESASAADEKQKAKLIVNTLQMIVTADILLHPVVPSGAEKVAAMLGLDTNKTFNWDNIFKPFQTMLDVAKGGKIVEIKEKEDFFKRHPWQLEQLAKQN